MLQPCFFYARRNQAYELMLEQETTKITKDTYGHLNERENVLNIHSAGSQWYQNHKIVLAR
jgi:hypothetical protein